MKTPKKSQVLVSLALILASSQALAWGHPSNPTPAPAPAPGCDEKCAADLQASVQALRAEIQSMKTDMRVPVGTIVPNAGEGIPTGYVEADGRLVNPAYNPQDARLSRLCGVIGDAYRLPGDVPGTCRLPDLRGRTAVGSGQGEGLTERRLGELLGEEKHVMTVEELASHAHGVNDPGHVHPFLRNVAGGQGSGLFPNAGDAASTTGGELVGRAWSGISIEKTGESKPFNVMQPSLVVRYLIKY